MNNITFSVKNREIRGNKPRREAKEIFEKIKYCLTKLGNLKLPNSLEDDLGRAILTNNEHEIYENTMTILHYQMNYMIEHTVPLLEVEIEFINTLVNSVKPLISFPDYCWLIDTEEEILQMMRDDDVSDSLAELEEQYDLERMERFAELEYDGYSTD